MKTGILSHNQKIIKLTQEKYSELTGEAISYDEAFEIIESLCEYSRVLIEIEQSIKNKESGGVFGS